MNVLLYPDLQEASVYSYTKFLLEFLESLQCLQCGKKFQHADSLKKHVSNIHGESRGPFSCAMCGRVMKNKNSLYAHVYNYHKRPRRNIKNTCLRNASSCRDNRLVDTTTTNEKLWQPGESHVPQSNAHLVHENSPTIPT